MLFLDAQKAYDMVSRNGFYECSRGAVLLDGEKSASLILV